MAFQPPAVPFWGSSSDRAGRSLLFGAPLDVTGSGRLGTGEAPPAIRRASHNIETFSPALDGDLFDAGLADLGDLDLAGRGLEDALRAVEQAVAEIVPRGIPVMIGGEHTATLAAFRAVKSRYSDAAIISLDAHLDLADELDGERLTHGTWAARLGDEWGLDCLALLGVRSGTRDEWTRSRNCLIASGDLVLPDSVRQHIGVRPVYLTLDIDVVDPAGAPGTGCPEPGGPTSRELFELLYSLRSLNLVALDVVEVLPEVDPAAITATLGAKLIREAAIQWGRRSLG